MRQPRSVPAVIHGRRHLHASPRMVAVLAVVLAALAASLLLTPAAAPAAATLSAADAPGYRAAGSGAKLARAALGPRLPKALRGAAAAGTRLAGPGGATLVSGVFTTATEARAKQALAQARGGGRRAAGVGDGAWLRLASTRRAATATIVLRTGRALGVVRLTLPGRRAGATATAAATVFARTLAAHAQREQLSSSAFQQTLDGIGDDGSISPATALKAFAIAYGPLPGVKRPSGSDLGVPQSATLAMQLVARVWDRIAPAQRAAVERRLGARHDDSSAPQARAAAPTLTPSPRFQAIADRYVAFYAGKLPGYSPVVRVFTADEEITDARGTKAWADALPLNAADQWGVGAPAYCRVRVPPLGQARAGGPFFQLIMAHEVFHCFQFQIMTAWRQRSAWIIEGMADWAATSAYATTAAVGAGPYRLYLASASAPAFGRSYDATGVWHALDESHGVGSLWPNVALVLNAADDGASFVLAGGGDLSFTETWASAAVRLDGAGAKWRQARPYALPRLDPPVPMDAITSDTQYETVRYQAKVAAIVKDPAKPLVGVVGINGRFRVGAIGHDYGLADDERFFCFGSCKCRPPRTGEIPPNTRVTTRTIEVALTGGALPGAGRVQYHSMDEYCRDRRRRSGPAESNGDPHLTTFDGLHYDFQAAGEFVLARARDGSLEIQARQEPYRGSRTVTVNTQIAAKVGGRRVTISPGASKDDPPVVRVDGQLDPLPGGSSRALGDGTLGREGSADGWVDVTWPDGSTLVVRPVGNWGVATVIQLDGGRAGRVAGLLGDYDGRVDDDLADRGGRPIAYTARASSGWEGLQRYRVAEEFSDRFFDALYDDVGDSWRIRQSESLFDYAPGQSTKTFTLGKVPTKPVGPEELRRQQRAEAERICRAHGVTQPGPLADCITDVAATGNAAFADDAREAQDAASTVWRRLGAGSAITGDISLARSGDGVLHVGYNRDAGGNVRQLGSVAIDAAGHGGAEETIAAADGGVGLFAAADGSVHAVSAEIPNGASSGVYQYGRDGAGAWSPLGLVTGFGSSYASRPSALALPDGRLVTVSPMAGVARVFSGAPAAGEGTPVPVPDGCYGSSPSIARDAASGAVFVAWLQWDCPQVGIFAAQYDPASGGFGAPVQAPGSTWSGGSSSYPGLNLSEDVALTARPGRDGLFLAYESGPRGDVALWRIGAPGATKIARRRDGARHVRISADPADGRLWVGWEEPGRWWFQRTTAAAAPEGAPRPVAPPANDSGDLLRLSDLQISARGGGLDLVHVLRRGDTPGALSYARLLP